MPAKRPQTIPEYIEAAPLAGQPHLRKLYKLLGSIAPKAEGVIKWGNPFFIEPRFLYAFSAHKAHLSFMINAGDHKLFAKELKAQTTTRHMLKVAYDRPLPEALIRKIAKRRIADLRKRKTDSFW